LLSRPAVQVALPLMPSTPELEMAFRHKCRMGDLGGVKNMIKAGEVDCNAPADTERKFTALHIACWGSMKASADKDIVESILMWAQKTGNDQPVRDAVDAIDSLKPIDLAKERRDSLANSGLKEDDLLEEKRKFDKIIEWLEKGLPAM